MNLKKYYDEYDEQNKDLLNKQTENITKGEKEAIDALNKDYAALTEEAQHQYDADINLVDVQKRINERKVAEAMANYGLSDSGLNRTQQTAVQLGADNAMAQIKITRQRQVDALARELQKKVGSVRTQAQNDRTNLENAYLQNRTTYATNAYNDEIKAKNEAINKLNEDVINASTEQAKRAYINAYLTNYPDDADRVMKAYGITKDENGNLVYNNSITSMVGTPSETKLPSNVSTKVQNIWADTELDDAEKRKSIESLMSLYGGADPIFQTPRLKFLEEDAATMDAAAMDAALKAFANDYGTEALESSGIIAKYFEETPDGKLKRKTGIDLGTVKDGVLTYYGDGGEKVISQVGTDVTNEDLRLPAPSAIGKNSLSNAFINDGIAGYIKKRNELAKQGISKGKMDLFMAEKFQAEGVWDILISARSEELKKEYGEDGYIFNITATDLDNGGWKIGALDDDNSIRYGTITTTVEKLYDHMTKAKADGGLGMESKLVKKYLKTFG